MRVPIQAIFVLIVALGALAPPHGPAYAAKHLPVEPLSIETETGAVAFEVEIAATPEARQRGLMFREALAWNAGMLFDFYRERPVAFWMKDTPLSLDMIFIGADGVITGITADVEPLSETLRPSPGPVMAVLELRAGAARRFGIEVGQRVRHRIFPPG